MKHLRYILNIFTSHIVIEVYKSGDEYDFVVQPPFSAIKSGHLFFEIWDYFENYKWARGLSTPKDAIQYAQELFGDFLIEETAALQECYFPILEDEKYDKIDLQFKLKLSFGSKIDLLRTYTSRELMLNSLY